MKKLICILFTAMVALGSVPVKAEQAKAVSISNEAAHAKKLHQTEVNQLTSRLKEIHTAAKGELSTGEKALLRKEVLAIKQRLADPLGGGVYISAGALILIVIL
ncbi:MAG: hypothetical protein V4658_12740, partial [Bacteroidota bacterium]